MCIVSEILIGFATCAYLVGSAGCGWEFVFWRKLLNKIQYKNTVAVYIACWHWEWHGGHRTPRGSWVCIHHSSRSLSLLSLHVRRLFVKDHSGYSSIPPLSKNVHVSWTGVSKLLTRIVCGCLSVYFGPVIDWWPVNGPVPALFSTYSTVLLNRENA